jgi:phage-related protein
MSEYTCIFYETREGRAPVEEFIESLDERTQEKFIYKQTLLGLMGPRLRHPHTDDLGDGLLELRFKGIEGQIRVLFFFMINKEIILVHGFVKKTQKTPKNELRTAYERMQEYLRRASR